MTRTARLTGRIRGAWSSFAGGYRKRSSAVLRISVGILFLWFGVLKFTPAMSPAEDIAIRAMGVMTFGAVPAEVSRPLLATMEVAIGLGLVTGILLRLALTVFFVHMLGVFSTLVILADEVWSSAPFVPTMDGQYILKNIVLIAACLAVATAQAAPAPAPGPAPAPADTGVEPQPEAAAEPQPEAGSQPEPESQPEPAARPVAAGSSLG
ncbi:DoxX family membrane protein [Streptomyces vilmorinianum]|uniref:DoxX family membrane protein n=1 Tax=Streptomyces vilmorinianum TaxID=3051092 RepID=UPI0010FB500A|nr:DoxX family membrane protein [Streptomyces vilmorinianum]